MADSKIKKLEKQLEKNLADKAKAKDSEKLAITKKIKKNKRRLKSRKRKD